MEKILITGGSGLLGSKLAKLASEEFEVVATYNKHFVKTEYRLIPLDITKNREVDRIFRDEKPDLVVHTAALTNVDYCEDHREEAWKINVKGTENLAWACKKIGAKITYISTDFIFDGGKGMYKEGDPVHPVDYYGATKFEGEKVIENLNVDHIIARVSVLYGWNIQNSLNFVTWIINALKQGRQINIVTDQYVSPTLADNAAEAIIKLIKKNVEGIFHTAGSERINRYDFALKIADVFNLDNGLINPIMSEELKQKAKRPKDSSLDVGKVEKIGIKLFSVEEGLTQMKRLII